MAISLKDALAKRGIERIDPPANTGIGKVLRRLGVAETPELRRIMRLPARRWQDGTDLAALLTKEYRLPGGTWSLYPSQAATLAELHDFGGAFASVGCGGGKTLISFLAPTVADAECTVIVVPAALVAKTHTEFDALSRHFRRPRACTVVSYEWLSREEQAEWFDEMEPDLIVLDEAHRVKNRSCAVWRRVSRYSEANPDTSRLAMSGTIMSKSLGDFAHIVAWTHGESASPLPTDYPTLAGWCLAVDESLGKDGQRMAPGALERLFNDEEREIARRDDTAAARAAVRRRLETTPAFVSTSGALDCDASLVLGCVKRPPVKVIDDALARLDLVWITPSGEEISDAPQKWAAARQLALGFEYVWTEPPPDGWMEARRQWKSTCRETLRHNRRGLDTEMQLVNAIRRGEYEGTDAAWAWAEWDAVRATFEPVTVPHWLSDDVVDFVAQWMKRAPGVVWVEHVAFGERLAQKTRRPFFASGNTGTSIATALPRDGSIIASVAAFGTGHNLQHWSRGLVVAPPSGAGPWEQLLSRMHRPGQREDEVVYDVLYGCDENVRSVENALREARAIQDVTGNQQRLLVASVISP